MSRKRKKWAQTRSRPAPSRKPPQPRFLQPNSALGLTAESTGARGKALATQPPLVQARLRVGRPNDRYEQQADYVADQVLRMPVPDVQRQGDVEKEDEEERETVQAKPLAGQITPLAQRQEEPEEEEEEPIQARSMENAQVQRQEEAVEEEEEEESAQTKAAAGRAPQVTPALERQIHALRGSGQPLDPATRVFMEPRFGHDLGQVRVHTDGQATETAQALNARAFTVGQDVVFGTGQYTPDSDAGKRLLAHELTHTVQQGKSVSPSSELGVQRQADPAVEKEVKRNLGILVEKTRVARSLIQHARERAADYPPSKSELLGAKLEEVGKIEKRVKQLEVAISITKRPTLQKKYLKELNRKIARLREIIQEIENS